MDYASLRLPTLLLVCACLCIAPASRADDDVAALRKAIQRLASNAFIEREQATEKLVAAGPAAIPLLEEAAAIAELESSSRVLSLLEDFALREEENGPQQVAQEALRRLAASKTPNAARAETVLTAIAEVQRSRAMERLEKLGAEFKTRQLIGPAFIPAELSVEIGSDWKGVDADLKLLTHVTELRSIVLKGPQVSDAWLKQVGDLSSLHAVRLKKAKITAAGLAELKRLTDMVVLEVLYVPLEDEAVQPLTELPQLSQLRLFGTKVSKEGAEKLAADLPAAKVDVRRGGFLGIGVERHPLGCAITTVQPGSAAEKMGMSEGDVILSFAGKRPRDFPELTQAIAEYEAGAEVAIELFRGDARESLKVTLGEWD